MTRLLVLLQNAYNRGALRDGWCAVTWRRELLASRTGVRLRQAIPTGPAWYVRYANACPGLGDGPDSKLQPCRRHLKRVMRRWPPHVVLACGETAMAAAQAAWGGPTVFIPHPAYRLLTNDLLARARGILEEDLPCRVRLVQMKGWVEERWQCGEDVIAMEKLV
jgi:hypothetical protein